MNPRLPESERETPLRLSLDALYERAQLCVQNGAGCPSYGKCRASCEVQNRAIAPPTGAYVGEAYDESRIMFVGINTNLGSASSERFYDSYGWISRQNTEGSPRIDGAVHRITRKMLGKPGMSPGESRRHFAFSNLVKCSVADKAGEPTKTMLDNCGVLQGYLFQEIDLLCPRVIFALGAEPCDSIYSHYIESVGTVGVHPWWVFSCLVSANRVLVVRGYNPGQGYMSPRAAWRKMQGAGGIPDDWRWCVPPDISTGQALREHLARLYPAPQALVDKANPLYELALDFLVKTVRAQATKE